MSVDERFIDEQIKNKYENSPYRIPLRNKEGIIVEFALVDEKDFERVNAHKWSLCRGLYANSNIKGKKFKMHHFVFQKPREGYVIDHINEDKLDNRLSNLREVTNSENNHNRCKRKQNATSKYKGVSKNKFSYSSQYADNRLYYGPDEHKAAMLYDIYTYQLFGKHANNNKLISYEEAMKYKFPEKKERILPKHITLDNRSGKDIFIVRKTFRGVSHSYCFATLEEAIIKVNNINFLIKLSLIIEQKLHRLKEIERNEDGIAYVVACDERKILVSDEDWHDFSRQSWYIDNYGYALNGNRIKMHKIILECEDKTKVIHHINNNTLDNRRENLAIVSRAINAHQKKKQKDSSSQYFGVTYLTKLNKWEAKFSKDGQKHYIGVFENEKDAARSYNAKVKEVYGEFANLNVIEDDEN